MSGQRAIHDIGGLDLGPVLRDGIPARCASSAWMRC